MTHQDGRRPTAMRIFLRGLAISLPSVLTLVILLWLGSLLHTYIISPTNTLMTFVLAQFVDDSVPAGSLVALPDGPALPFCGKNYRVTPVARGHFQQKLRESEPEASDRRSSEELKQSWLDPVDVYVILGNRGVPYEDYETVARRIPESQMPRSHTGVYMELVVSRHFPSLFHVSLIAVLILIGLIFLLGRFVTARIGAWIVRKFETLVISSVPVVRNVYGSVKQVTDFLFSENQIEVRRVIAFEYPRRGIWTMGFVTGESLLDISAKAGEPCVSVLVPTSPMPMTGYTMSVPRSDIVDLDISVEQAFQYIVSCGVLVPERQKFTPESLREQIARRQTRRSLPTEEKPSEVH